MKTLENLTAEQVENLLEYDPEMGVFKWKNIAGRGGRIPAGTQAGNVNTEGYRYIWIKGTLYRASRLAWLLVHREWPKHQVDHVNRNRQDDRIDNLREASQEQNQANTKKRVTNTTGFTGVTFDKDRMLYTARIRENGVYRRLGRFTTAEEAHEEYKKATKRIYGIFAHSG